MINRSHRPSALAPVRRMGSTQRSRSFRTSTSAGISAPKATPGASTDTDSYFGRFEYGGDLVRRARRPYESRGQLQSRSRPRPAGRLHPIVRDPALQPDGRVAAAIGPLFTRAEAGVENFVNGAGHLETRVWSARFNTELQNSDNFSIETSRNREVLVRPLPIAGVSIPPGDYAFGGMQVSYAFGQQRRASGSV